MTAVDQNRRDEEAVGAGVTWRRAASVSAVVAAVGMALLLIATGEVIPPAIVLGILFVGIAVALRRSDARWPLYVAMALPVLTIVGNAPFIVADLSHPDTPAGFVPTVVIVVAALFTLVAAVLSKRDSTTRSRPVVLGALGIGGVAVLGSAAAFASLSDDERRDGDVEVRASQAEYPDEIRAEAGEVGFFLENDDAIRHTFLIEGTAVDQEVPGATDRRVTADLDPGTYRFYCDVVGHDDMEGILIVE